MQFRTTPTVSRMPSLPNMYKSRPLPTNIIITQSVDLPSKMTWGKPTWFLFHTLAEKIKPEYFNQIIKELVYIITLICNNLPCPNCAEHATAYLKGVNVNSFREKQDLKDFLFVFHNSVNLKKNAPIFEKCTLDSQYATAITANMIQHFFTVFQKKNYSIRMIANDFHKQRSITIIKQWFINNIKYFNP